MRFVFRADASLAIGAGHIMRSTAIAEEVIARGIPAVFIGKVSELPWVTERITHLGFEAVIDETSKFRPDSVQDILILDSYQIPVEDCFIQPYNWHAAVNIFDDLTPPYQSSLRVHPGLTLVWEQISDIRTISGPSYIPLRKSIRKSKSLGGNNNFEIIVVGGGSDSTEFVSAVTKVLLETQNNFHANLFVNNGDSTGLDNRFSITSIGQDLDAVADKVDLVFTTASTTSLEFLARGCSVAIGCAVDNQELYYKELSEAGFAAPIGRFINNDWALDSKLIKELVHSESLRADFKANSSNVIDLDGAKRIVDEVLKL